MPEQDTQTIGALLYPGFELLDLYGPLEMFGSVGTVLRIITVGEHTGPVASAQGPQTVAEFDFAGAPHLHMLLVPGGIGTLPALQNEKLLQFLTARAAQADITMSVCSGSALLARAGLLNGYAATSNKQYFDLARAQSDQVQWQTHARWVDAGRFVTSSGVSAGIDMALAVIARIYGIDVARKVAAITEYQWHENAAEDPFAQYLNAAMAGVDAL